MFYLVYQELHIYLLKLFIDTQYNYIFTKIKFICNNNNNLLEINITLNYLLTNIHNNISKGKIIALENVPFNPVLYLFF